MAIRIRPQRDYLAIGEKLELVAIDPDTGAEISAYWWINNELVTGPNPDDDHLVGRPTDAIAFVDANGRQSYEAQNQSRVTLLGKANPPDANTDVRVARSPYEDSPKWRDNTDTTSYYVMDIELFADSAPVNRGDSVMIGPEPRMPDLVARMVSSPPAGLVAKWRLALRHARRNGLDDRIIEMNQPSDSDCPISASLTEIIGGDAVLSGTFGDMAPIEFRFSIRGHNPTDGDVEAFVGSLGAPPRYALAILQHESRFGDWFYNQFNPTGNLRDQPNFGPPDGWGICQLDSARGSAITTAEVWDWKSNVRGGMDIIRKNESEAPGYFDAVRRTHPQAYEPPPATYIPPGTHTAWSHLEAASIQMYNGSSVVERLMTASGGMALYRSCWKFDPNRPVGQRWKFIPNQNDYVQRVTQLFESGGPPAPPIPRLISFRADPASPTADQPFSLVAEVGPAPRGTTVSMLNTRSSSLGNVVWDPVSGVEGRELEDRYTFRAEWPSGWGPFQTTTDRVRLELNHAAVATMTIVYQGVYPNGTATVTVTTI